MINFAGLDDLVRRTGVAGLAAGTSVDGQRRRVAVGTAGDSVPLTVNMPMRVGSVTKPIVAAATLLACRATPGADRQPVIDFLPDFRDRWTIAPTLTLRDLLSHTSGLLEESLTKKVLASFGDGADALTQAAARVVNTSQEHPPGTLWQYYNGNYYLAAEVPARLGGDAFEAVVDQQVLTPAGMTSTSFDAPDTAAQGHRGGTPVPPHKLPPDPRARRPTWGLWSTVDDLLSFGEFLLADTELTATVRIPMTPPASTTQYGLGWCIEDNAIVHWGAATGFGYRSALRVIPADRTITGILVNDEYGGTAIDELLPTPGPW